MLLRTMFLLALVAVVAETILHGAAALAIAALHQRALDAARIAFASGVRSAQSTVAQAVEANPAATAFPIPSPSATCAYADAGGCELNVQTVFATPTPAAPLGACPQTDCTVVLQANSAVAEARASMLISTVVTAPGGATLASRSGVASFRTYAVPPYASLVGGLDATVDGLSNGGAADDAGSPDSLITVQYAPSAGGTAVPGNVWQSATEASATAAPAWDH